MFANGPRDLGSIPGCVIPKTLKMVLDTSLLNTQQCKVRIEGNSGAIRGKEQHPPLHLGVVASEKGAFWSPSTTFANFTLYYLQIIKYILLTVCPCDLLPVNQPEVNWLFDFCLLFNATSIFIEIISSI